MPLTTAAIEEIAAMLAAARGRRPGLAAPAVGLADEAEAYRVQDAVARRLGPVIGWKVGARSPDAPPTCAPLLAGTIVEAAGPLTVNAHDSLGIEVEVAFRIGRAFLPGRSAPSASDVLAAVRSACVAVELCQSRFAAGSPSPLWHLADNGVNAGLVLGAAITDWRTVDRERQRARMIVDGKAVVDTAGGNTAKDLQRLIVWLVGHCVTERGGIAAGAVITTGSWIGLNWVAAPASVVCELTGLGSIAVDLRRLPAAAA